MRWRPRVWWYVLLTRATAGLRRPTLTPRGRKVCQRATAAVTTVEQGLLELLEPSQREIFLSVLRYYTFDEFVDGP